MWLRKSKYKYSIYSCMFANVNMNAKKIKLLTGVYVFQRAVADKQKQIEYLKWLYLKTL